MIGADNITRRSEGPLAGCATATAKTFGSRSLAGRWGRSPTQVALGNAAGRLPGGSRMRENLMSGLGRGSRKRGSPPRLPHFTRVVVASRAAGRAFGELGPGGTD